MTDLTVTGLSDLQRALDQFPAKFEANVLRGALRAGAKVQLLAARDEAPSGPPSGAGAKFYGGYAGALKDGMRITTSSRGGVVKASVKAGGKTKGGANTFYARFVEFGTKAHDIKPKERKSLFFAGIMGEIVHHPGAKAQPFMMNALTGTMQAAVDAVAAYIRKRLTKEGIELPDPGV